MDWLSKFFGEGFYSFCIDGNVFSGFSITSGNCLRKKSVLIDDFAADSIKFWFKTVKERTILIRFFEYFFDSGISIG